MVQPCSNKTFQRSDLILISLGSPNRTPIRNVEMLFRTEIFFITVLDFFLLFFNGICSVCAFNLECILFWSTQTTETFFTDLLWNGACSVTRVEIKLHTLFPPPPPPPRKSAENVLLQGQSLFENMACSSGELQTISFYQLHLKSFKTHVHFL